MDQLPQLKMVRVLQDPPPVRLAEGYSIRPMGPGEEWAWVKVLNTVGDLGEWTVERAMGSFAGAHRVWRDGVHLVWCGDVPVGTTCVQLHDDWADLPELGWVAVDPAHQGKGLGTAICATILGFMASKGYAKCYLTTDDQRLPAIRSYLNLGFEPVLEHESHAPRWREVLVGLGMDPNTVPGGDSE